MTANVPTMESGTATPGMKVAERLRRNRKITITTRQMVSIRVNFTSLIECSICREESKAICSLIDGGIARFSWGNASRMLFATSTVFAPGCFCTARMMPRTPPNQLETLLFSTLSITWPICSRRMGTPLRYATMSGR